MASPHDASWESKDSTGRSNKTPVLTQDLPDKERSALCAVLPWPRMHLYMTHQEPDHVPACGSLTVSPCGSFPYAEPWSVVQQGAFRPTESIPRTDVPVQRHSSPWLEARELLAHVC